MWRESLGLTETESLKFQSAGFDFSALTVCEATSTSTFSILCIKSCRNSKRRSQVKKVRIKFLMEVKYFFTRTGNRRAEIMTYMKRCDSWIYSRETDYSRNK